MIVDFLLPVFLIFYLLQVAIMAFVVWRPRDTTAATTSSFVSVIIAARDEEQHIAACLHSVLNQTYPAERFEVIVINDHSSDKTEMICQEFARRFSNFRFINAREDAQLRGKTNALDQGIENARGDIILITDADCTVPPTWVEWTSKRYSESIGIVGGLTLQKASNWFEGMQSLDWAFILGLAATTMSLRIPLSTIGNNLSFRKSAYKDVGGYRTIPFSVTEDFMLFQAIVQTKKWDYICPVDPKVLVTSQPCPTWKDLFRQKQRWGKGGLDMRLSGLSFMVVTFGIDLLILLTPLFGTVLNAAAALLMKAAVDFLFLYVLLGKQGQRQALRYFPWFEAYIVLYVLMLPFVVFFGGRVVWKGRVY
jgi:cellulose synthase/poly-beta-1,6-N-acetylglucosamine synthase-like glycosyltransferase